LIRSAEWLYFGVLCLAWVLRRRTVYWRAELLLGLGFGALWERLFFDFWTYSPERFGIFVAPNLPLAMIGYWAALFIGSMALGEAAARAIPLPVPPPWRQLLWDVVAFAAVGIAMESVGLHLGLWQYNAGLSLGVVPLLRVSTFAALGYVAIGVFIPTSLRHWREHLIPPSA